MDKSKKKVESLFGGPLLNEANPDIVKLTQNLTEHAKSGELRGIICICMMSNDTLNQLEVLSADCDMIKMVGAMQIGLLKMSMVALSLSETEQVE